MQRIDQIANQLEVLSPAMTHSRMHAFCDSVGIPRDYNILHKWSIENLEIFWTKCWKFLGITGKLQGPALTEGHNMIEAEFFVESEINIAENVLSGASEKPDEPALVFVVEGEEQEVWSWRKLENRVHEISDLLQTNGLGREDRVCGLVSNTPDTVAAMLASLSLGAIWSSVSPDFGVQGICERFEQLKPKLLFAHSHYVMKGKKIDIGKVLEETKLRLGVQKGYILNYGKFSDHFGLPYGWEHVDAGAVLYRSKKLSFARTLFNDPCFILFSSGTTGRPKCIVHKHGVLLQLKKEHVLHCDMRSGERVFYYTTTTWMMWHWLITSLASKVQIYLWEGSVFYPSSLALIDFCAKYKLDHFGISAKYVETIAKLNISKFPDVSVRNIYSTGSVLSESSFDFLYRKFRGSDFRVNSISGGTDILSCFLLGCPLRPVMRGRLQCAGLGLDVRVFVDGQLRADHGKGELVCVRPFVSQPVGFWDAELCKSSKIHYAKTYFRSHAGNFIWFHGDFISTRPDGQFLVYGRSDATLKPGGVRIGTGEIYRALEELKEVKDAVCVEVRDKIWLFVVFQDERADISEDERNKIKNTIKVATTRHHVPAFVEAVKDVPRTRNGKLAELAVKATLESRDIENINALANPESIDFFTKFRL